MERKLEEDDVTDLALMWEEASIQYYNTIKMNPTDLKRFKSVDEILEDRDIQNNFQRWRDYGGTLAGEKVAKMRHLIVENSECILKGAEFLANSASAAFPPSSAILTALTWVMKASESVSKDYDKIQTFFEELNEFLQRINMIEKTVPKFTGYRVHLMKVFTVIMKILGLTTKATREGRLKRFGKTILRGGGDDELAGAYSGLVTAFARLESATNFANLAVGYANLDNTNQIKQAALDLKEGHQDVSERVSVLYELNQKMLANFDSFMLAQTRAKKELTADAQPAEVGEGRQSTLSTVKAALFTKDDPGIVDRDIQYSFVEGTASWMFQREEYVSWREESSTSPLLWITGDPGTGKSCLAYSVTKDLARSTASESKTFVGHFYWREGSKEMDPLTSALKSIVAEMASHDSAYCNEVATEMARVGPTFSLGKRARYFWKKLIMPKFSADSETRLYLVLDGSDEVNETVHIERQFGKGLQRMLKEIFKLKLSIRVMILSRPSWKPYLEFLGQKFSTITLTKESLLNDMRMVIDARLNTFSRLHKARMPMKKIIRSTLLQKADCMLYVEHMLRRLNKRQDEKTILEELQNAPSSLTSLLESIETEIQSRRTEAQLFALQNVYAWLTFSHRPLVVGEINGVAKACGHYQAFSIAEEVLTRSGAFLDIVGAAGINEDDEQDGPASENETIPDVGGLEVFQPYDGDSSLVKVLNRPLRDYLRRNSTESPNLRIPTNRCHIMVFEFSIKLICSLDPQLARDGGSALNGYAATYWGKHFQEIDLQKTSDQEVASIIQLMRCILTNCNDAAKFIETHCETDGGTFFYIESLGITKRVGNEFMDSLMLWMERASAISPDAVDEATQQWIGKSMYEPLKLMALLAKGHIVNWLEESKDESKSYDFAVDLLNLTDLAPAECFFGGGSNAPEFIKAVASIFGDIHLDSTALRAIANLLAENGHDISAMDYYQLSLNLAENEVDKVKTRLKMSELMIQTSIVHTWREVRPDQAQEAHPKEDDEWQDEGDGGDTEDDENYFEGFKRPYDLLLATTSTHPPTNDEALIKLFQESLMNQSFCEMKLGLFEKAVASFARARLMQPDELLDGESLTILPSILAVEQTKYQELIENLHQWNVLELMAWLNQEYEEQGPLAEDPNTTFGRAGHLAKNDEFVTKAYEEIIRFMDQRNMLGARKMRYNLAKFHINVSPDLGRAKRLLYEILDSHGRRDEYGIMEEEELPSFARKTLAEILYEQFRSTASPLEKAGFMEEMSRLQDQRLKNARLIEAYEYLTTTIYASMLRKMGSTTTFQEVLNDTFEFCIALLTDAEGWNDAICLRLLAKVLALVGGLEREAQIAFSLQYSTLDPAVMLEEDFYESSDSSDDEDDTPLKGDQKGTEAAAIAESDSDGDDGEMVKDDTWGDLSGAELPCRGEHMQNSSAVDWANGSIYLCILCADTQLCQGCYEKIRQYTRTDKWLYWKTYCGRDHKYIKGPIDGWKGVRDGTMMIGEAEQTVANWIKELKEVKWSEAWEKFWKRQDGVVDILGEGALRGIRRRGAVQKH